MPKKVIMDPEDFSKLVDYIIHQPVRFEQAGKAVEIKATIEKAVLMEIEIKEEK
jgi:hypothetical protein